jgi:hypothetical protein
MAYLNRREAGVAAFVWASFAMKYAARDALLLLGRFCATLWRGVLVRLS